MPRIRETIPTSVEARPSGAPSHPPAPAPLARGPRLVRGLTLVSTVALVVGNMVGTSVYTLPASLALGVGPIQIVSWTLAAAGYLFVALVYASIGNAGIVTGVVGYVTGFVPVLGSHAVYRFAIAQLQAA